MFHNSNNIKQSSSYAYHSCTNINDNNEYINLTGNNNDNELLLTSSFTPMTFFDLQQQYSYQPITMNSSSNNIDSMWSPPIFYDNHGVLFNEDDSGCERQQLEQQQQQQQQQPYIPMINNDDHSETYWKHSNNNTALIHMLLAESADAPLIDDNDDPSIFCSSNSSNATPSSSTVTTITKNNHQSSSFTITPPSSLSSPPISKRKSQRKKRKSNSNARIGYCQHPKHMYYREENANVLNPTTLISSSSSSTTTTNTTNLLTPRRGRPPKGTKAIDKKGVEEGYIWAMTVRPLPKRLEAVVGQTNIKVCLTCLKRSDLDQGYLNDSAYVGPQQQHYTCNKRKKNLI